MQASTWHIQGPEETSAEWMPLAICEIMRFTHPLSALVAEQEPAEERTYTEAPKSTRACSISEMAQSSLFLEHRVQRVNKRVEMSWRDWQEAGPERKLGQVLSMLWFMSRTLNSLIIFEKICSWKKSLFFFKKNKDVKYFLKCQGYREPFWSSWAPGQFPHFADSNFETPREKDHM